MRNRKTPIASRIGAVVILATLTGSATAAWSAGGDILWSTEVFQYGYSRAVKVAATKRVAVALDDENDIEAVNLRSGWVDDLWSFQEPDMHTRDIAAHGKMVVTAGRRDSVNPDAFVRAYDAATANVLWTTLVGPPLANYESFGRVVMTSRVVVAIGESSNDVDSHPIVAAFDAKTGARLWVVDEDKGVELYSVAITGKVAGVVGRKGSYFSYHGYVHLFDLITGTELLSKDYDDHATYSLFYHLAIGKQAVVVGGDTDESGGTQTLAGAYDFAGNQLWSARHDYSRISAISIVGKTAVIGGYDAVTDPAFNRNGVIRAYDLATGTARWTVVRDGGGNGDSVNDLAMSGRTLVSCGGRSDIDGHSISDVVAIDARTGAIVWTAEQVNTLASTSRCRSVALVGNRVMFVADHAPSRLFAAALE